MGVDMGTKSVNISKKELMVKSVIYRIYTTLTELILAYMLKLLTNIDIMSWVILINLIKLLTYFAYDLGWFSFLHKPGVLKKIKRWAGVAG
jgi:hypothetical protein